VYDCVGWPVRHLTLASLDYITMIRLCRQLIAVLAAMVLRPLLGMTP
jgi:hypothetical protein